MRSSPKFFYICRAIGLYYKPHNESSISVLKQLVDLHSSAPGLDDAVASALRKIGTKDIVPVVAELLDSQDPQAQLRAASFFGFYSLFADAKGDVVQGNLVKGPFATADTRQYTPRSGSSLTPSQYASFWKTWWLQNSSRLGFAAQ
ncbi:MAG TPA: hypothetical protein VFW83_08835 [Bryobacteraceae bacterium]|nr:hypothetical protein [Bryobacteraceae bacterium]